MITYAEKAVIIPQGSYNQTFYIIAKGSVTATVNKKNIQLTKGDIVGIFDLTLPIHSCSYTAAEEVSLIPYEFTDTDSLIQILDNNQDLKKLFILSFCRTMGLLIRSSQTIVDQSQDLYNFINNFINKYHESCHITGLKHKSLSFMEELHSNFLQETIPFYLDEYFSQIKKIVADTDSGISSHFVYGFLERSQNDIIFLLDLTEKHTDYQSTISSYLLNEDYLDLFDLLSDLYFRAKTNHSDTKTIENCMDLLIKKLHSCYLIDQTLVNNRISDFQDKLQVSQPENEVAKEDSEIYTELSNSVNIILAYADSMKITNTEFKKNLILYKQLSDKSSTDQEAVTIRKQLTKLFYLIYNEVVQENLKGKDLPIILKMFVNFGYVDPELCGYENAFLLYKLAENYHGIKEQGIYTFYEWILEIYKGNKEPSRNEFDVDYTAYLRNLKREGKINREIETELSKDCLSKVMYELQNMFIQVNKMTSGRILSYCPILTEEHILRPLDKMIITPVTIVDQFQYFANIDYSAFYHEVPFQDTKVNVKETLYVNIRPDVILFPNIGSRGVLWQEIEGMRRTTPGRMMISAFHIENVRKTFARMIGEFRWEMCKRDLGARWNDFSIHSLTSDYCDYAQFYNKNHDLSYESKEKIKISLKKHHNNFKEFFISDYLTFVLYESNNSCRLNKIARTILFTHCPFTKTIRDSLKGNGAFQDLLDKYRIKNAQEVHRLNQIQLKYQNANVPFPEELLQKLKEISNC